jgi:multidrug efflux pump subunit AcrA (membrane-fusion protein)
MVVYRIENEQAKQQLVETGLHEDGWVAVQQGLKIDDHIVVDGASFLTDGTPVTIQQPRP